MGVQRHYQTGGDGRHEAPRQIDGALVDAYMARRALVTWLVYPLPVLWRKLPAPARPAVCSRSLRLVCDTSSKSKNSCQGNTGRWWHADHAARRRL